MQYFIHSIKKYSVYLHLSDNSETAATYMKGQCCLLIFKLRLLILDSFQLQFFYF